ncbi:superfamily II DNA or RNA helicase [Treponema rectale]|uniref:Superfamily II DNA or RNA helicase n=1 Tax=Treponema rectale TaxID=744512 RepID=A0A840SG90_9SPIR|nr:DEAD/DEAH box helicase [Treponema rectale]MBB5219914.1 superfamily II DNA or RNA helicase [Treponema rectale]
MESIKSERLLNSLRRGFISSKIVSDNYLMPSLLVNDQQKDKRILSALTEELSTCETFDFSVAFINDTGLASILEKLEYLEKHNIKGRILTTNYLNFTSPGALSKLLEFSNIEVRVYTQGGFHPKGYIFKQSNYYSVIIGSANLTASALSQNQEWSLKFLSLTDGQIVFSVREEFERIWNNATLVTEEWISGYKKIYIQNRFSIKPVKTADKEFEAEYQFQNPEELNDSKDDEEIVPNSMQEEAMVSLAQLREKGERRALLIAATGTGKTYLSIFDVKQVKPKRVLYVAHRDMILNKSEQSFKTLMGNINTGFLNGNQKDLNADYLFASVFTLAKDEILFQFKKDHFDYIIIDEVHHAGASSYKKIIDYFTPNFLLGLTATPERTDGFDIFSLFNNNIPYEIRLQKALEENLLCPFHYYGLSDLTINGELIDDKSDFSKLVSSERIHHIEHAIKRYKSNDIPVKGLIFCSRIEEANELSRALNNDGFFTTCLTGANSDSEREKTIQRLENDDDPLQYIISVDIFNEGVDIPCVNQVVMLRPTQSAIIFVQQLGRGLRKDKSKSYVSVIDFIGNYENNFFIPITLFGDNSYNKDNLRRALSAGSSCIPGTSTIQINEIAKQKIFDSISQTSFKQLKLLKEEYNKLKLRLAKVPAMMDFVTNGFIDPLLFIDYSGSYFEFKSKLKENSFELNEKERKSLQFVSNEFAHGIRVHELLILNRLLNKKEISLENFKSELENYCIKFNLKDIKGMTRNLSLDFYRDSDRNKYGEISYVIFDEEKELLSRTKQFESLLNNQNYKTELEDCIQYGLTKAKLKQNEHFENHNLVLYRKYSRKDVFKILNWAKDENPQNVGGYMTKKTDDEFHCPVFVTYEKSDEISDSIKYKDFFIDNTRFNWMSKSKRSLTSPDVSSILNQADNHIQIMLFVKKDDNEGTDFYYMGNMKTVKESAEQTQMESGESVVNIQFDMETPVTQNMYNYLEGLSA